MIRNMDFDKDEFIEKFKELKTATKMAKEYGCSTTTILNYAHKFGYDCSRKPLLSPEQIQDIINKYETCLSKDLAKDYGVSRSLILKIWIESGCHGKAHKIYTYNENYFESIDSPDKAYFLGLMAADGCVYQYNDNRQSSIKLSLSQQDEYVLDRFNYYMQSNKPINYLNREPYLPAAIVEYSINKMALDLKKYNIVPRKTYTYEPVILSDWLMPHYFRGYIDGDGWISTSKQTSPAAYRIGICGFKHNLYIMQKYLTSIGITTYYKQDARTEKYKKDMDFGSLTFENIVDKYCFLRYIYDDCKDLYMPRKKEVADQFFDTVENNYSNKANIYKNAINYYNFIQNNWKKENENENKICKT